MNKLQKIYEQAKQMTASGQVASYIPALAAANRDLFAVGLLSADQEIELGDCTETFTLQSVVKVISF
ncbi:MAG: glutaminase, partial [Solibacillus isronensis]